MKQNRNMNFITVLKITPLLLLLCINFQTVEKVWGAQTKPAISKNQLVFAGRTGGTKGLRLIGTVVTNFSQNLAVIQSSGSENVYSEGDTVGGYVIKKIQRNRVVINTPKGDVLLSLLSGGFSSLEGTITATASLSQLGPKKSIPNRSGGRYKSFELAREDIINAVDNIDMLIEDGQTTPFRLGTLSGVRIKSVPQESILRKIGLKSHDVILELNGRSLDKANGTGQFNTQISDGKKVTIKYRRRNRTRRIVLNSR